MARLTCVNGSFNIRTRQGGCEQVGHGARTDAAYGKRTDTECRSLGYGDDRLPTAPGHGRRYCIL
eukprot:6113653-Prymnesium_polylepis.1